MQTFEIKKILYPIIFILTIFLLSCEEETEESNLRLNIEPKQDQINKYVSENLTFNISAESNIELKKFTINQKSIDGTIVLKDTTIEGKSFYLDYFYEIPLLEDSTEITLIFNLTASNNEEYSMARRFKILQEEELLEEITGNTIHSSLSGGLDAFNFTLKQPMSSDTQPDSLLHIKDNSIENINQNTLSREFISPAGYNFVRFESMNYPQATQAMIQNAYDSGIKLDIIKNIQNEDIIVIGKNNTALAAILITQIIDADSTLNDKYLFNYKMKN
jgi:hypothetical protein